MKKNQPPPLPQPTLSSKDVLTNTIRPILDAFTLSNETIDRVVDKGTKILYNAYLRTKISKHNSDYMVVALTEAMTQEVMPYDPGESIDCLISNWMEDEEPEGTVLDSWSVQTARVTKPRNPTPTTMNNDSFTSLEGPGSKRNSLTGKFRNSLKRFSMLKGLTGGLTGRPSTKDLDHVSEQVTYLKAEYDVQIKEMPVTKEEEDKVVDQIREEIALRKKIKQKKLDEQAEVRKKQEELKDRIKTFERQSKDNAFTFDYDGNVIYVSKQGPAKMKNVSTYNLKNPLETLKRLPSDTPIRSLESEGDDLQKLSLLSTKQLTQQKYGLSKTAQFRDEFNVKPGVMLKMPSSVKQGPEYKDENRMRRDDFMKILDARKNEKGRPRELNQIAEEEETEDQKRKAESALMSELRKLAEMNQDAEIETHQQEYLIQMLMNTDSRKISELYNIGKGKSKMDIPPEDGSARKSILEDRIVEYNKTGISEVKNQQQKPSTKAPSKIQVSKIQQGLDNYNRNLIQKETWGQEKPRATPSGLTPLTTPRLSPDKKSNLKMSIFESHAPKEPRERTTVGQKRALQTARASVDPESAMSPNDGLLSARGADSEAKKFIIRSATKEKIADDFGFKSKAQGTKTGGGSKNDSGIYKIKASASVSSITKSNQHTPRLRVNV